MKKMSKFEEFVSDYKDILRQPVIAENDDIELAIEAVQEAEEIRTIHAQLGGPGGYLTVLKTMLIVAYYKGFLAGKETKALEDLPDGSPDLS